MRIRKLSIIFVSVFVSAVLLLFAESALRIGGFRFDSQPRYMEFNYPNPHEMFEIFEPDPDTFWRLKPGAKMGSDVELVNSKGFRGAEFSDAKPQNKKRLIALGDSVTFGGSENYPRVLGECLGDDWEVINAGVPGYSVYQGLRFFEKRAARLKPDVVTVMFGWNDHWLARGYPDSKQNFSAVSDNGAANFLRRLRLFQMMNYFLFRSATEPLKKRTTYRVPVDEYGALLKKLVAEIVASGGRAVLLTPPSALDRGKVPQYVFDLGFAREIEGESEQEAASRLMKLHGEYNDVVKRTAAETGSLLVDLEADWYRTGAESLFRDPSKDATHPNEEGYRLMGKSICNMLKSVKFSR